MNNQDRFN